MTKLQCKYMFHDKEKFDGENYCTLFNEKQSDINFVCDKNCQIFEDEKILKQLKSQRIAILSIAVAWFSFVYYTDGLKGLLINMAICFTTAIIIRALREMKG